MLILLFVSSCSLFRTGPSLKSKDIKNLLDSIKMTGEGRGRLSLGQTQYVFRIDGEINENSDWILAVTIPLHGEEVMILPNLRKAQVPYGVSESFEARIDREFHRSKTANRPSFQEFFKELRFLIRFAIAKKLALHSSCASSQTGFICELDGQKFQIEVSDREFTINKYMANKNKLQLVAKNLTNSFFQQTSIRLFSNENDIWKENSGFALEFFWKN